MVQSVAVHHDGTASRYIGRLGLIIPGADEKTTKLIAAEISAEFKDGSKTHIATATWRPHDTGIRLSTEPAPR